MKDKTLESAKYYHETSQEFYDYYSKASLSDLTVQRMMAIQAMILRILGEVRPNIGALDVLDVGCGAGSASILWSKLGHSVYGLDVNEPLIGLAQKRAEKEGVEIDFRVGSATDLPWDNQTMDICLAPELLEHVSDWEGCLDEFSSILKSNGILFLCTVNKLCPKQNEFTLPLYSWYPGFLKRYCVNLALTSHPQISGYAKYPAVNWFTPYQLRDELVSRGFRTLDRFDCIDVGSKGLMTRVVLGMIKKFGTVRWLAHVASPYSIIVAIKTKPRYP